MKKSLRKIMLQKRKSLSATACEQASILVVQQLIKSEFFLSAKHIACYAACKNEMNVTALFEIIWQSDRICYLPRINTDQTLSFVRYDRDTPLKLNPFGILEPDASKVLDVSQLDVVLVPLVAFDPQGNRLGMGAGHYDRTFAQRSSWIKLVGVAYSWQCVDHIDADTWDVALDAVLTEVGFLKN